MNYRDPETLDFYIKVDPKEVKPRVCLSCQRKFESEHKFNRVCPNCKNSAKYISSSDIEVSAGVNIY